VQKRGKRLHTEKKKLFSFLTTKKRKKGKGVAGGRERKNLWGVLFCLKGEKKEEREKKGSFYALSKSRRRRRIFLLFVALMGKGRKKKKRKKRGRAREGVAISL